ncbi:MAG TPA: M17 family peptidase N-terminal domain-containing protein, partial [Ottowia sp.]|nr:M17 family peptidase N-terminal domain-containing protein [Ottowia sp.]
MDFELQPLRLADAATGKAPALVVLVADGFVPGDDALSALIARALGSGDFKTEAGAQLFVYGAADIAPPRVVLAGIGDGSAARVRKAVAAAMGAVRGSPAKALTLCFAQPTDAAALRAAVLTVADASYVYRATKSKPKDKKEPPRVARVLIGAPDAGALREPMQQAVGVARGVELAREWANRPAN